VFTHVAGQLTDGVTLYSGTWDHKPPGIYLVYAAGQLALPFLDRWVVTWLISVACTSAAGLVLLAIMGRMGVGRWAGLLAAAGAVAAMAQYLTALGGGLTEPVAALPLAWALLLALAATPKLGRGVAIGALLAVAGLIALPVVPGALGVVTLAVLRAERPHRVLLAVGMVAGGLLPLLLVVGWLGWSGALGAAVDAVLGYSSAYRLTNQGSGAALSAPVATWTTLSLLFLLAPAIQGALHAWRAGGARRQVVVGCLVWAAASVVLFAYQGRFFAHYAIPLALPLGLLAAFGLERFAQLRSRAPRASRTALLAAPFALTLAISVFAAFAAGAMEWSPVLRDHERSTALAAVIDAETDPNQAIWVWGNETELYLAADRPSATRYSYLYPLVTPGYATARMVAGALAQLEAEPPALIVDAGSAGPGLPGFQELLIPRPLTSDGRDLDLLDPLRAFVRDRYEQGPTVDGWVIYRLRP
jgi:hypothetical protein